MPNGKDNGRQSITIGGVNDNATETTGSHRPSRNRRTIPATCTTHGGTRGFTNLVVSKRGATIELDPHTIGACVIQLDKDGATALRDALIEWLG